MAMSEQVAQREAVQAIAKGNAITPMGYGKAQEKGSSTYSVIPDPLPASLGIEQGTELVLGHHAPTNTVLLTPVRLVDRGQWADFVLGELSSKR